MGPGFVSMSPQRRSSEIMGRTLVVVRVLGSDGGNCCFVGVVVEDF